MKNHIFFSFLLFLLYNFFYIYKYLNYTIFLSNTGQKLEEFLKKDSTNIKNKKLILKDHKIFFLKIIVSIILILVICTYFTITISNHQIEFVIVEKKLELKSFLGEKLNAFILIYELSAVLFSVIITNTTVNKVYNLYLAKYRNKKMKEEQVEQEEQGYMKNIIPKGVVLKNVLDDENIIITNETLYKNFLITGSIGCGKTVGAISNITYQLLKQKMGGLILDAKGNFVDIIKKQAKALEYEKKIKVISIDSNYYFNLLDKDIAPMQMAAMIKKVILLLSNNNISDSYFLDKVENTLFNLIIILKTVNKYEILEIHRAVTSEEYLMQIIKEVKKVALSKRMTDKEIYEITRTLDFFENEFLTLDKKTLTIIKSEITRFTIPLVTDYDIYSKFIKGEKKEKEISLSKFEDIVILSINIGKNKELCKIIATMLKLIYQKKVIENIKNISCPKFIIIDEYQEFVNEEDAYFLSISREAKCVNVIATQSYNSIKCVLKNEEATQVIIQNLVNKIWFRNDDSYTVKKTVEFLGKKYFERETKTYGENSKSSTKNILSKGFKSYNTSLSEGISISKIKENEYDEIFFTRELKLYEALMFYIGKENLPIVKKVKFERWDYENEYSENK